MRCKDFIDLISAYADNELSLTQRDTVEGHLTACFDCRTMLADFQAAGERLATLRTVPATDIREATMRRILAGETAKTAVKADIRRPAVRWLRPALIGVPVMVVIILLTVLQPWTPTGGNTTVFAADKIIAAMDKVQSCRVTKNDSILYTSVTYVNGDAPPVTATWTPDISQTDYEFVLPDRVHYSFTTTNSWGGDEYIRIGDKIYYKEEKPWPKPYTVYGTVQETFNSIMSWNDTQKTKDTLNNIKDIKQLADESIDGVSCFHYEGLAIEILELYSGPPDPYMKYELWVGKQDNLIHQIIIDFANTILTRKLKITYYDFNQAIKIEAPVTDSGSILDGWNITSASEKPPTPAITPSTTVVTLTPGVPTIILPTIRIVTPTPGGPPVMMTITSLAPGVTSLPGRPVTLEDYEATITTTGTPKPPVTLSAGTVIRCDPYPPITLTAEYVITSPR